MMHTQRYCRPGLAHRPQPRGVRSPAGTSQTAEETVPGVDFALEACKMFCVRQGLVESLNMVNRVVIVRKKSNIHNYI